MASVDPQDFVFNVSVSSDTAATLANLYVAPANGSNAFATNAGAPYNTPIGGALYTQTFAPMVATDIPWTPDCAGADGHLLNLESAYEDDGGITGVCSTCLQVMKIERVPGGMSYVLAGRLVGEAMALDDDEETVELMGELAILEHTIEKEIQKLHRAQELVVLSRQIANKRAISDAKTSATAD